MKNKTMVHCECGHYVTDNKEIDKCLRCGKELKEKIISYYSESE